MTTPTEASLKNKFRTSSCNAFKIDLDGEHGVQEVLENGKSNDSKDINQDILETSVCVSEGQNEAEGETGQESAADKSEKVDTEYLVLDTNVILTINNNSGRYSQYIDESLYKLVTVPQVIGELTSKYAKQQITNVKLEVIEPDNSSVKKVITTAKETGDFGSLSIADIKVIALGVMLAEKYNVVEEIDADKVEKQENTNDGMDENVAKKKKRKQKKKKKQQQQQVVVEGSDVNEDQEVDSVKPEEKIEEGVEERGEPEEEEEEEEEGGEWSTATRKKKNNYKKRNNFNNTGLPGWTNSDDGGWITPKTTGNGGMNNIGMENSSNGISNGGAKNNRNKDNERGIKQKGSRVKIATMDFAMQNVILTLEKRETNGKKGVELVDVSKGQQVIKKIKTFVLRCHSCFATTHKMDTQFCTSCGHPTLLKTSISTTEQDEGVVVHLKKNFRYNLRGKKYSIPSPANANHLVLRADDKTYTESMKRRNMLLNKAMRTNNADDVDAFWFGAATTTSGSASRGRTGERFDANGMPIVGVGRRNPNKVIKTGNKKTVCWFSRLIAGITSFSNNSSRDGSGGVPLRFFSSSPPIAASFLLVCGECGLFADCTLHPGTGNAELWLLALDGLELEWDCCLVATICLKLSFPAAGATYCLPGARARATSGLALALGLVMYIDLTAEPTALLSTSLAVVSIPNIGVCLTPGFAT
ncbi:20S-pre-rRNA D-site endonuclease nob1 [Zancudomyces culisetae]|uniref:20S-pre-rRNA D-site endonuclease nob1 n=1 Tax=Zancudomyces culisetae TaxID=1213189 RepID=A0A1R1PN83_ZANCU|nr:20S-pre-rRNA D-site endonuclease nob1 [Zancudomyces culisetae]|eukprot:OMH82362.1 20S-pre-rRNA D-site endonuclease nob1 [Zancudomyces culisetae]